MQRSIFRKPAIGVLTLVLAVTGSLFAATDSFKDPLDTPAAAVSRQITSTLMNGVTRAGSRLVAVGIHGLIEISDDDGKTWTQASVPVASDLLDVSFPTAKDGWAVGHDGVVLHSSDGGKTWEKQLDGLRTKKILIDHFESMVSQGNADAQRYLQDTKLNYENGPEQTLLSVWFEDARHGFVAGSFGTLLATNDGGKSWESWVEKVDVDMPLHYYAIRGTKSGIMIASEKGSVFRLDSAKQRFVAIPTGYSGTFFSLVETGDNVLVMGLRGAVYRLKGAATQWEKVDAGVSSAFTGSASMPKGQALLVTQSGQLILSRNGGDQFQQIPVKRPMLFTGVVLAGGNVAIVAGNGGLGQAPLQ